MCLCKDMHLIWDLKGSKKRREKSSREREQRTSGHTI